MANSSPHPMIAESLMDLNRFLSSSKYGGTNRRSSRDKTIYTPCMQLNFSNCDGNGTANDSTYEGEFGSTLKKRKTTDSSYGQRHRDSVTGLDVCHLLRNKDLELVDAQASITQLKTQLSAANTEHTKMQLEWDSALSQHRLNDLKLQETVDELELKLKHERQKVEEIKDDNNRIRDHEREVDRACDDKISKMNVHVSLADEYREKLSCVSDRLSNAEKKLHDKLCELDLSEAEVSSLREEAVTHLSQLAALRREIMQIDTLKLQLDKEKATIKELEGRLQSVMSQEHLLDHFESSVAKLPDLERQLSRLKEENDMYRACSANTRLLEEQVASAADQISRLQERSSGATQLKADLNQLQSQLDAFKKVLCSELSLVCDPQPEEVRVLISGLRNSDKGLTDNVKVMRDSVASHERECSSLQRECRELLEASEKQQQMAQRQVQLSRRQQRKLVLVTKERDSLKSILTSYEAEATMTAATACSMTRLTGLEEALHLGRLEIQQLEMELDQYQQTPVLPGDKSVLNRADRSELIQLKQQVCELKDEISQLQEQKDVLEYRLEQRALKGDYDPSQVNVIHMKQNPTSEAEARYEDKVTQLEEEVKRLTQQLKSAAMPCTLPTPPEDAELDSEKIEELEKEVKRMEMKHQRYIEAFKVKSKEMRELVYRLMGYLVVPAGDNCYKLSHLYAESPEDYFTFEFARNGELRLLSTTLSSSLEDLIELYLSEQSSYPAFLAAVTVDLFNKQTMMVREDDTCDEPTPGGSTCAGAQPSQSPEPAAGPSGEGGGRGEGAAAEAAASAARHSPDDVGDQLPVYKENEEDEDEELEEEDGMESGGGEMETESDDASDVEDEEESDARGEEEDEESSDGADDGGEHHNQQQPDDDDLICLD